MASGYAVNLRWLERAGPVARAHDADRRWPLGGVGRGRSSRRRRALRAGEGAGRRGPGRRRRDIRRPGGTLVAFERSRSLGLGAACDAGTLERAPERWIRDHRAGPGRAGRGGVAGGGCGRAGAARAWPGLRRAEAQDRGGRIAGRHRGLGAGRLQPVRAAQGEGGTAKRAKGARAWPAWAWGGRRT